MLHIRRDQILTLQATLDEPVIEFYIDHYGEAAAEDGLVDQALRDRITRGVALGRELDAGDGYEMATVVALTTFLDPEWQSWPPCDKTLRAPGWSLEAKLRYIQAQLQQPPEEES